MTVYLSACQSVDWAHSRESSGVHGRGLGVSAPKVEVLKKGSRADFLHYTASIEMVDHGSTRITPRR